MDIHEKGPPVHDQNKDTHQTHHSSSSSDSYTDSSITLAYYMSDLSDGSTSFPDGDQFALSRDPSTLYVALGGGGFKSEPLLLLLLRTHDDATWLFSTEKKVYQEI